MAEQIMLKRLINFKSDESAKFWKLYVVSFSLRTISILPLSNSKEIFKTNKRVSFKIQKTNWKNIEQILSNSTLKWNMILKLSRIRFELNLPTT